MKRAAFYLGLSTSLALVVNTHLFAQGAPAPSGAVNAGTTPATPATKAPSDTQVGTTPTPSGKTQEMEAIIVTGSAIPTTDAEGAAPVVVVNSATIEKRAYRTAQDVLRNVPAAGSFSSPGQTSGAFAAGAAYVSLRGLGPQATLVLINGRRVTNYSAPANGQYAFVDLNNIPAQLIDRVEVLTEGTALYGADAVAGVVNIITKKDLGEENGEVDAYVGNTDSKDAFYQRYTLMGNLDSFDKNGYGVVEVDYTHQNSIMASDRDISKSSDQSRNGGFDLRSGRTFPGQFSTDGGQNNFFSILPGTGNIPLTGTTNATDPHVDDGATALQGFDYNPYSTLTPETERYGVYLNYTYKFYNGDVTPNLDFDYRHNRTVFKQAPAGWRVGDGEAPLTSIRTGEPTFIVPTTNFYNRTNQTIDILAYRFTNLDGRVEDVDNDVFRVVPSVDIKLGDGWTLNAGFNFQYSFTDDRNINYPSARAFQNALNSADPATAYNPFTSSQNQAPGVVNNLRVSTGNRDTTSLIGTDFRFNGKLFDLPAGPVQIAIGGEYRLDRYNQGYSPADLQGDVISSTVQLNTSASRKELSGYTEVNIPLTSPSFNIPGFYSVAVDAAARVDKYSTFGSTENPQVSLRWETIPGLILRGSYARSFRAPGLPELFAGGNQAVVNVIDNFDGNARDVTVNGGGNPNLKPETAETFSAGVAYSPEFVKGLLVTADFFKIRYTNQILQQDPQILIDQSNPLISTPQVTRNPDHTVGSVTATYSNAAASYIQGIDLGFNYVIGDPNVSYGQFTFGVNGTWLLNYKIDDGTGQTESIGNDSNGVGPYSRYRQDASITWDFHNFEFVVSNNFSSPYTDTSVAGSIDRNVALYTTFDLQASYTFDKQDIDKWAPGPREGGFDWRNIVAGTRIAVGVNNVYDTQPPFTANPANNLGYDPTYADPTGRFLYGQLTKKF